MPQPTYCSPCSRQTPGASSTGQGSPELAPLCGGRKKSAQATLQILFQTLPASLLSSSLESFSFFLGPRHGPGPIHGPSSPPSPPFPGPLPPPLRKLALDAPFFSPGLRAPTIPLSDHSPPPSQLWPSFPGPSFPLTSGSLPGLVAKPATPFLSSPPPRGDQCALPHSQM